MTSAELRDSVNSLSTADRAKTAIQLASLVEKQCRILGEPIPDLVLRVLRARRRRCAPRNDLVARGRKRGKGVTRLVRELASTGRPLQAQQPCLARDPENHSAKVISTRPLPNPLRSSHSGSPLPHVAIVENRSPGGFSPGHVRPLASSDQCQAG